MATPRDRARRACAAAVLTLTALGPGWPTGAAAAGAQLYRLDAVTSTAPVDVERYPSRIVYTTVAGFPRTVPIAVRRPPGAGEGPLPVVIIAHGGGEQPNDRDPATTLPEWGESLARAGYLAINLLHGTNVGPERGALCQAVGFTPPLNPAAFGATLQQIGAAIVQASGGGGGALDLAQLVSDHPGLFDDLAAIGDPGSDESPLLAQVAQRLIGHLGTCQAINALGLHDRPHDVAAVVNALHDGVLPELAGWVDLDRVGLLGHSNGTSSVLNAVGMQRALPNGVKIAPPFPAGAARRPRAAVALSPMGVNTYGLYDTAVWRPDRTDAKDHSWAGLSDLPVMTVTGDGDNHCKTRFRCSDSDSPAKRRIPFWRMPEGDKYLMYIADRNAEEIVSSHEFFGNLDRAGICPSPGLRRLCTNEVKWVESTVIAFLDAYVRDSRAARGWLRSKRLARASAGIATLARR